MRSLTASPSKSFWRSSWQAMTGRQEFSIGLLLLALVIALSLRTGTFLTGNNLVNVLRNSSWIAIAAFGEAIVIIAGGIDLSVGSVMALTGLVTAFALQAGWGVPLAVAAGLATGGLAGSLTGILISRGRLPSFIVTLGMLSAARGIAFGLTSGEPVRDLPSGFVYLGQHNLSLNGWEAPLPVVAMLVFAGLTWLLLSHTVLGGHVYALGSDETALWLAGVDVDRLKVMVYALSGLLAAIAGALMTARLGVAAPTAAAGYELDIIAAAMVGGVSWLGGKGTVWGVLLGAVMMQVLRNGMVLLGFPTYWQAMAIGVIIIAAIALDRWRAGRA
jgi:ribose transport system permease protein